MKELFFNELKADSSYGMAMDLRFSLAEKIVLHCAMVAAKENGEDSSGRQALGLMPAKEVATRALDIAGEMIDQALERNWMKPMTVTDEERAMYGARLQNINDTARFAQRKEVKELVAKATGTAVEQ